MTQTTDWLTTDIGSFAPLQRGFDLPNRERVNGDYPVVYSNGVMNFHHKYQVKGPGVVTGRSGTIGKVHYVENDYWPHNTALWVKEFNNAVPKFVYYLYSYIGFERFSSGSGVPTLNRNDAHGFVINVPQKKEEQTSIANALSDVDALLTELEKLIAKKQAIKTATMQQLLTGKTRLPQFATYTEGEKQGQLKGTKMCELVEIPEDWDGKTFGEVMSIRHGKDQKAVQVVDGLYPIFGTGGKMGTTNIPLYDKPSVLIGRKGTINKPRYADNPFWTVDTLFYSEISSKADPKFIFYKFSMIDWMQYNEASGVPSLNASTIESVTASFPSKQEQTAIAIILSDMDSEIQTLEQRLTKTRQIKQGMMQELLTGRTRLPFEKE
ncbi:restriction endonuclease subunit S [Vibrio artabrorum]|uniref:restriction endonuclease subunit S n=1 Tax=Vibrio artabrorum TaxID=446374 RepID=UPI0021C4AAE6|nr:restriction endonuclease subunit S [Vibrio artabrorum]